MPPRKKKVANNHDLDDSQISEVREAFDLVAQGTDTIPMTSVVSAMSALGIDVTPTDRKSITAHLKAIDPREVSFDAFLDVCALKLQTRDKAESVANAFALFDTSGTGKITIHDLRRISKELGEDIKEQELMDMMIEAGDLNGINESQFEDVMTRAGVL